MTGDPHFEPHLTPEQEQAIEKTEAEFYGVCKLHDDYACESCVKERLRSLVRDVVGVVEKERDALAEKLGNWAEARAMGELLGSRDIPGGISYVELEADCADVHKRLAASEASAEELMRARFREYNLRMEEINRRAAAEASAQRLTEALGKIATYNCEGDGPGTICGDCAQSLARTALDEAQKVEP